MTSNITTPELIERLHELLAKATPAPWHVSEQADGRIYRHEKTGDHTSRIDILARDVSGDNAQLITEVINALPVLLDRLADLTTGGLEAADNWVFYGPDVDGDFIVRSKNHDHLINCNTEETARLILAALQSSHPATQSVEGADRVQELRLFYRRQWYQERERAEKLENRVNSLERENEALVEELTAYSEALERANGLMSKAAAALTPPSGSVEEAAQLKEWLGEIGTLPICPLWTYEAIRHCQRNMDLDLEEGFNEPDRYAGTPMAKIINALPGFLAALSATPTQPADDKDGEAEYEVYQGDEMVASSFGPKEDALKDALHYCMVYGQDGPECTIMRVYREPVPAPSVRGEKG